MDAGEQAAAPYLRTINQLFRIERLVRRFKLKPENFQDLRSRRSVPLADKLFADALAAIPNAEPKTRFWQALNYLLGQRSSLQRCLSEPGALIHNNPAENCIRPLKLGAKNWQAIGHPSAGPRLANLFSLVENCRQEGIDPEAYLIDIITRLSDHPMKAIAELLPRALEGLPLRFDCRCRLIASGQSTGTGAHCLPVTVCLLEMHAYSSACTSRAIRCTLASSPLRNSGSSACSSSNFLARHHSSGRSWP